MLFQELIIEISEYLNVKELLNFYSCSKSIKNNLKIRYKKNKIIHLNILKNYGSNIFEILQKGKISNNNLKFVITSGLYNLDLLSIDNVNFLMMLSYYGYSYGIELLLKYKRNINLNYYDNEGNSAFWLALVNKKKEVIKLFIKYFKLNISVDKVMNKSPLWIATVCRNYDVLNIIKNSEDFF